MPTRRGTARQQVPADFAAQLRALRDVDNPLLNALLAACRDRNWRPPALAAALDMKAPAVSKRIERARQRPLDAGLTKALQAYEIPEPEPIQAMLDGRQLDPDTIKRLREMRRIASRVNGAVPMGHPDRQVGERFAAELNRLIAEQGYTAYYLADVIGVSHRAITSRLERHHFRDPCPSVAGTSSGIYYGRKIGDPGIGAPRLSPQERTELRDLWQAHIARRRGARAALAARLRQYLDQGFTLANLSQAMTTRDMTVRFGALQALLTRSTDPAPEELAARGAAALGRIQTIAIEP